MTILALALHILGAIVWVGGMFAIYMCLRPALGTLEPPKAELSGTGARPRRDGRFDMRPILARWWRRIVPRLAKGRQTARLRQLS